MFLITDTELGCDTVHRSIRGLSGLWLGTENLCGVYAPTNTEQCFPMNREQGMQIHGIMYQINNLTSHYIVSSENAEVQYVYRELYY